MSRTYDDDLFKESTMTFGQHLEELRVCLFRSVFGLVIGVCFGLLIGWHVVEFIKRPLTKALEEYYLTKSEKLIAEKYPNLSPELKAIVLRERKVFEEVSIEPGILFEDLKKAYPDQLGGVDLAEFSFQTRDILSPEKFCKTLREGNQTSGETAGSNLAKVHIWSLLSDEQKTLVKKIADAGEATDAEQEILVATVNSLLQKRDLYDEKAFANYDDKTLSKEVRKELNELPNAKSGRQVTRWNWTLLATVFDKSVASPHPYLTSIRLWRDIQDVHWVKPIAINQTEGFMFYVKASFIAGLIFACPWIFLQIWTFVGAGLYPHERRYVYIYLPFSVGLFLAGAALTFFMVFAPVLKFLFDFNDWLGIEPSPRIADWMSFVLWMPLAFGISFQLPLVMLFIERIGVVEYKFFIQHWRIAVLTIFVLAAVLNPSPDPYSMLLMAMPLVGLYLGGIAICWWGRRGSKKAKRKTKNDGVWE